MKKVIAYCIVSIFLLLCGCSNSRELPEPKQPEEIKISTESYENSELNFTIDIPSGWNMEINDQTVIWTEQKTGTELSIQSISYSPQINNVTQDNILYVTGKTGELTNYNKPAGNIIEFTFQNSNNENIVIDESCYMKWSYSNIYLISYRCEHKYFNYFQDYYTVAVGSLTPIENATCIAEGYAGYYNSSTNLYLEYPMDWSYESFSSGFSITSPATGTVVTADNVSPIENFAELSDLDYLEIMRRSVQNIALSSYSNNGSEIIAELYYQDATANYYVYNYMANRNNFILNITFFANVDYVEQDSIVVTNMLNSIQW